MSNLSPTVAEALTARLRDGDRCRFCGVNIYWTTTTALQRYAGTYARDRNGELYVACLRCEVQMPFDTVCPLRDDDPVFTAETAALIGIKPWEAAK